MTLKRQLREALDPLAKVRYTYRARQRPGRPIVVLSPGKAGSTAIGTTLAARFPDRPVFKVHWLSAEALAESEAGYRIRHEHILASHHVRRRLPTPDRPWDVIIPVREPVARNVAAFFQTGERLGHSLDDPERAVAELVAWHHWSGLLTWFDTEVRDPIGVDVYDHPFDKERGWQVIDAPTARVLLIRQEDLAAAPEALSTMFGVPITGLVRANVGAEKPYAAAYEEFCRRASIPAAALDELYDSRYARHLYTDEQIAVFRERWA